MFDLRERGKMTGRENFDYVTMDTYSGDMAELSGQAKAVIMSQLAEVKHLRRLVWMLVVASGGTVKIHRSTLADYSEQGSVLTVEHMAHDQSLVVRAR